MSQRKHVTDLYDDAAVYSSTDQDYEPPPAPGPERDGPGHYERCTPCSGTGVFEGGPCQFCSATGQEFIFQDEPTSADFKWDGDGTTERIYEAVALTEAAGGVEPSLDDNAGAV